MCRACVRGLYLAYTAPCIRHPPAPRVHPPHTGGCMRTPRRVCRGRPAPRWSPQPCPVTASRARRNCDRPPAVRGRPPESAPEGPSHPQPVAESGVPPNRRTAHRRWPPSHRAHSVDGHRAEAERLLRRAVEEVRRSDGNVLLSRAHAVLDAMAARPPRSTRPAPAPWTRRRPTGSASRSGTPARRTTAGWPRNSPAAGGCGGGRRRVGRHDARHRCRHRYGRGGGISASHPVAVTMRRTIRSDQQRHRAASGPDAPRRTVITLDPGMPCHCAYPFSLRKPCHCTTRQPPPVRSCATTTG